MIAYGGVRVLGSVSEMWVGAKQPSWTCCAGEKTRETFPSVTPRPTQHLAAKSMAFLPLAMARWGKAVVDLWMNDSNTPAHWPPRKNDTRLGGALITAAARLFAMQTVFSFADTEFFYIARV
jgi:hypothetical protein